MDRRDFLRYAGVAGTLPVLAGQVTGSEANFRQTFEEGDWSEWATDGVANLAVADGTGVLEAATNVYPSDRRAAVFRPDERAVTATITATIAEQQGVGPGLVLRRVGPETYYAAVFEREAGSLQLVARVDGHETVLARHPVGGSVGDRVELTFGVQGTNPTSLRAAIGPADPPESPVNWPSPPVEVSITAADDTAALQEPGDPGVLGTAETGLRTGPDWKTGAGTRSARAVWVVDQMEEGDDGGLRNSPVPIEAGREAVNRRTSTTVFERVEFDAFDAVPVRTTVPSTVAATALRPTTDSGAPGALLGVVADVACDVAVEIASDPSFAGSRVVDAGATNEYGAAFVEARTPTPGERFYWRPRLTRGGRESVGPTRSAPAFPPLGSPDEVSLAIGSCATQFGETFDSIAAYDPDAFVWHGDLNYLDASGPLAQTESGYTGMWKDLLSADELRPILDRSYFVTQRDDHDYGKNDAYADQIPRYTIDPYEGVVNPDVYYRFGGGLVDVWVTETRRWKDPLSTTDEFPGKSLLGDDQREWLLNGLRQSKAPFKLVCSPGPLFNVPNDSTSWAKGYTAERDHVLDVIADEVSGRTVFVTGDTHSGCVTQFEWQDRLDVLEVRAAPLDIPGPGQHDASSGDTVVYSEQGKFFATTAVRGEGNEAVMDVALRNSDGTAAWGDTLRVDR